MAMSFWCGKFKLVIFVLLDLERSTKVLTVTLEIQANIHYTLGHNPKKFKVSPHLRRDTHTTCVRQFYTSANPQTS